MNGKRYLLLSTIVVLMAACLFAALIYLQDSRLRSSSADRHLETIGLAQKLVESQDARDISTRAQLIAGNQAVVGYVTQAIGSTLPGSTVDSSSIVDLLQERSGQLGLAVAAVIDNNGRLIAATERFSANRDFGKDPLFMAAQQAQSLRTGLLVDGTRLLHIAILPLASYGSGDAYLLVGMPVGQEFTKTIADIGSTDVALVSRTSDGMLVAASTLDPEQTTALRAALPKGNAAGSERQQVVLDGSRYRMSTSPLLGSPTVKLVALVSPRRDAASFSAVRLPMLVGGALMLALLIIGLRLLWTSLLGPAWNLGVLMERAASTGDIHMTVPVRGAAPIRRMATAFNQLLARL